MTLSLLHNFRIQDYRDDMTLSSPTERQIFAQRVEQDKALSRRKKWRTLLKILRTTSRKAWGVMNHPSWKIQRGS